jgi:hypothetical protein
MPEPIPQIYQSLTEQERLEADYNLVGLFSLLLKIDRRIKSEQENNLMKGKGDEKENCESNH